MNIEFKFIPGQYVCISLFDLDAAARVVRCIFDGLKNIYCVDFAISGEIKSREFYEDELEEWRQQ